MMAGMEPILRGLEPTSPESRRARREALALESAARFGRGNIRLQDGNVLFEEELAQRRQQVAARVREHQET